MDEPQGPQGKRGEPDVEGQMDAVQSPLLEVPPPANSYRQKVGGWLLRPARVKGEGELVFNGEFPFGKMGKLGRGMVLRAPQQREDSGCR